MKTPSPLPLLRQAATQIANGERVQAWHDVHLAARAAPDLGLVHVVASRLLFLLGDHEHALDEARVAAQLGTGMATMLCINQAQATGRYHIVTAMLEEVLRSDSASRQQSDDRTRRSDLFDHALQHLLQLYTVNYYDEAAASLLERYLPQARGSASLYLQAARVYEHCGEPAKAESIIQRALTVEPPTTATSLAAAALFLEIGSFDEARRLYEGLVTDDTASSTALEALGRLHLWMNQLDSALACSERLCTADPNSTSGRRIGAAVDVLNGVPNIALPLLDAILRDDPHDGEAYLWRAEALLRLGRKEEACTDADRSCDNGFSFAARLVRLLAAMEPRTKVSRAVLEEFAGKIILVFPDAAAILARGRTDDVAALLERVLAAMAGNRTPLATFVRGDGTLGRLPRSTSVRAASRRAMELIKIASPQETLRHLDELVARYPDSSMPLVHRGELHLWLGRYTDARADLEAAIAVHRQTRWAWYGLACLDLLAGHAEASLAMCAKGIRVMGNTEGAVAFSYRGEAYRLLSRLDEAREQLMRACALHPSRLSAWINLALVHGAAGDRAAQREILRDLRRRAPALLSDAARALGDDVFCVTILAGPTASGPDVAIIDQLLQQSLAMMRGNRSSSCVTYFTKDGDLRHVPQRHGDTEDAREIESHVLGKLRSILDRAINGRSNAPT